MALAGAVILFAAPLAGLGQPVEQPPIEVPEQEPPSETQPVETTTPQSRYEQAADAGAAPRTRHELMPHLFYGMKLELNSLFEHNLDLNDDFDDSLITTEPRLSLAVSYQPHRMLQIFASMRLQREYELLEGADLAEDERKTELELRDAYIALREFLPGLSLQVGRQRFRDTREWLFDEQLDAARLIYATDRERIELSFSREDLWFSSDVLRLHDKDDPINNFMVHASTRYRDRTIAGYVLARDGRGATVENDIYYGVHSHGEITDDLEYWLEAAALRGRNESGHRNRGVAVDLGLKYDFDTVPWRPSLAIGYARGSGDPNGGNDFIDETFRQTGMQDNSARFNGVTRVRYYGELLDPELSNLTVLTAAVGVRPTRRSSIDLVWHYYEQVVPDVFMRNDLRDRTLRRIRLTGLDDNVGHEIDLVAGYREVKDLDLELTLGYFLGGRAMRADAQDNAFLVRLQARYNF